MIKERQNYQEVVYALWQGVVITTNYNHVQDVPNIQKCGLVIFYNENQVEVVASENISNIFSNKKPWWNKCIITTSITLDNLSYESYNRIASCFSQYIDIGRYNVCSSNTKVKNLMFEEEQYLRTLVQALLDLRIDLCQYNRGDLQSHTLYTYTASDGCHADIYEDGGFIVFLKGARLSHIANYTPSALKKRQIVLAYKKIQPFIQNGILVQDYRAAISKSVALSLVTGNVITASRWKIVEVE